MKILHTVEHYFPSPGGAAEAVRQISEYLVEFGHDVTVVTSYNKKRNCDSINGVKIVEFKIFGKPSLRYFGEKSKYIDFLKKEKFDLIMNYAAQQWTTDLFNPIMDQINSKKILVPCGFSKINSILYNKYYNKIIEYVNKYDSIILLSKYYRDYIFLISNNVKNINIVPNGFSETEFKNEDDDLKLIKKDKILIVSIGNHTSKKGHKEIFKIAKKMNLKNIKFVIIGNKTILGCYWSCIIKKYIYNLLYNNIDIDIKTLSRNDTINMLKMADIFLFPSNIECSPIVIMESLAANVPFFSSDVGNVKEIVEKFGGGCILPTIINKKGISEIIIDQSVEILQNYLSHNIGVNVRTHNILPSWRVIAKEYERIYCAALTKTD